MCACGDGRLAARPVRESWMDPAGSRWNLGGVSGLVGPGPDAAGSIAGVPEIARNGRERSRAP